MSTRLAIVADAAAAGIAGLDGSFEWGEAATAPPEPDLPEADLVITFRDASWMEVAYRPKGRTLSVATTGEGLWSRAPWPVRDELFGLAAADPAAGLLVVTPDEGRDAKLLGKLEARGLPFRTAPELTAEALAGAAAVAFPPPPDAEGEHVPGARREAAPAPVCAVLAARRFLIAPRADVTFGLLPGVDHLAASTDDDVVQYADALHAFPEAFALQAALGRIAAERQRASVVYGRLVEELAGTRD